MDVGLRSRALAWALVAFAVAWPIGLVAWTLAGAEGQDLFVGVFVILLYYGLAPMVLAVLGAVALFRSAARRSALANRRDELDPMPPRP